MEQLNATPSQTEEENIPTVEKQTSGAASNEDQVNN